MIVGIFDLNCLIYKYCLNDKYGGYFAVVSKLQDITLRYNLEEIYLVVDTQTSLGWRKKIFQEYKLNRSAANEELLFNIKQLHRVFVEGGVKVLSVMGYEADDVIASILPMIDSVPWIITNDKDLLQIMKCNFLLLKNPETILRSDKEIKQFLGIFPHQISDFLALCGDAADNIPGIQHIGKKTAQSLIDLYCNIENIFFNIHNIKSKRIQKSLIDSQHALFAYREITRVDNMVPIKNINLFKNDKKDIINL